LIQEQKIVVVASVKFDEDATYYKSTKTVGAEDETHMFARLEDDHSEDISEQDPEASEKNSIGEIEKIVSEQEEEAIDYNNEERRVLHDRTKIKRPERLSYPQVNVAEAEPATFEEAIHSAKAKHWEEVIQQELITHQKNKTWTNLSKPENKKAITCKWIFGKKVTPGELDQYKARLVARGFVLVTT